MASHMKNVLRKKVNSKSPRSTKRAPIKSLNTAKPDSMQLVVYNQGAGGADQKLDEVTIRNSNYLRPLESVPDHDPSGRVLPAVGTFAVQCSRCLKWRVIPTKEKYEEIREHILEEPFFCDRAREWRPDICCDDPTDICQDDSKLWAMDKPNIAKPPTGWQRLLSIRGEGSTKFGDIYYEAPSGKRLRSIVEIEKYLLQHPEYVQQGVTLSQFSFLTPNPLNENYVRKVKRAPRPRNHDKGSSSATARSSEPNEVTPLSFEEPHKSEELRNEIAASELPTSNSVKDVPIPLSKKKCKGKSVSVA